MPLSQRLSSFVPRRFFRSRWVWSLAALLLFYTVGGFVVVPYLIERYLPGAAQEHLGRAASVDTVRINPYALTFEASGFFLQDKGDKPLLAFKRLFVNFELSSIFRGGWTFDEIRLDGAHLGLEVDRNLRVNLLEVLERLLKPPKPDDPPARVLIHSLVVADSRLSITDLSGEVRADAAFAPINVELSNLSTLADREGRYVLNARLPAGGTLAWKGRVTLEPIASAGELSIQGMKLESLWRFRRAGWNVPRPGGSLSVAGHYELDYRQGRGALRLNRVQAELADLSLALPGEKEPMVALRTIRLSDASVAFPQGEIAARKLVIADGVLNATVSDAGILDWEGMRAPARSTEAAPAAPASVTAQPAADAWRIKLAGIAVENVALGYVDRSRKPSLALRAGALNAGLSLDVMGSGGAAQLLVDELALTLKGLSATVGGSSTRLATLDALAIDGGRIDTLERSIRAQRFELDRGNLALAWGADGPEGLVKALAGSTPATGAQPQKAPPETGKPWRVKVDKLGVGKLALQYDDAGSKPGFAVRAEELNAIGSIDASIGSATRAVVTDVALALDGVRLNAHGTDAPLATLESFRLTSGHIDTAARTVAAKSIALAGGGVRVVRGRDGRVTLLDAIGGNKAAAPAAAGRASLATAPPAWRYRADSVSLKRFGVALADSTFTPPIAYDVELASVTANNVDASSRKPIAFTAALRVGKAGSASGEGTVLQDFSGASAQLDVARVPLLPLQPLLGRYVTLELKSGELAAQARVTYSRARKPELVARGRLALEDVVLDEAGTRERFASWKTLAAGGADLQLSPDRLAIREVRVVEPAAKIIIARDRSVNLTKIVRSGAAAEGAKPAAQPASQAKAAPRANAATDDAPAFNFDIETVRVENGTLDFADASLVLPFSTQVHALQGAIVGISSDPRARAQVRVAGQIDKYGEARADGALIPREPAKFMDITARFDNVDLGSLSPYSATFAGRKIAEGRLGLVLEYKIANSQLAGENRVVLRDFKLGERVDAPGASNLPLDLAIALLRDSEGRISLDVPIRGNIDDPQFEYSKVIWAAIANVLTRIVTAPFRALASLFGKGDADAVRAVRFEPGADSIAPSQREQLDRLAKALQSRPQLRLVVKGPYDPALDARALKHKEARLDLARALGAKLQAGQDAGPIAYDRADTQRALEKLLAQRAGPDAIAGLEKSFAKRTGRQPDRVNPVLGLIGRGSKDSEFYEAVYARLVEATPLPDTALRALADRRRDAILDVLAKAGIKAAQVSSGGIAQVRADGEKGVVTELALEAMAGAS